MPDLLNFPNRQFPDLSLRQNESVRSNSRSHKLKAVKDNSDAPLPALPSTSNVKSFLDSKQSKQLDLTLKALSNLNDEDIESDGGYNTMDNEHNDPPISNSGDNSSREKKGGKNQRLGVRSLAKTRSDLDTKSPNSSNVEGSQNKDGDIKVLEKDSPITSNQRETRFHILEQILIGNESRYLYPNERIPKDSENTHIWTLFVRKGQNSSNLEKYIKKVRVFLHPSYRPNDVVDIVMPPFELERPGNKPVNLVHILKLDDTFSTKKVLGTQQIVDLELNKIFDSKLPNDGHTIKRKSSLSGTNLFNKSKINSKKGKINIQNDHLIQSENYHIHEDDLSKKKNSSRINPPKPSNSSDLNKSALEPIIPKEIIKEEHQIQEIYSDLTQKINNISNAELNNIEEIDVPIEIDGLELPPLGSDFDSKNKPYTIDGKFKLKVMDLNINQLQIESLLPPILEIKKEIDEVDVKDNEDDKDDKDKLAKTPEVKIAKKLKDYRETQLDCENLERIISYTTYKRPIKIQNNCFIKTFFELILKYIPIISVENDPLVNKTTIIDIKPSKPEHKWKKSHKFKYVPATGVSEYENVWTLGHRLSVISQISNIIYKFLKKSFSESSVSEFEIEITPELYSDPDEFLSCIMECLDDLSVTETDVEKIVFKILLMKSDELTETVKLFRELLQLGNGIKLCKWIIDHGFVDISGDYKRPVFDDRNDELEEFPECTDTPEKIIENENKNDTTTLPDIQLELPMANKVAETCNTTASGSEGTKSGDISAFPSEIVEKNNAISQITELERDESFTSKKSVGLSIYELELYCKNCGILVVNDFSKLFSTMKINLDLFLSTSKISSNEKLKKIGELDKEFDVNQLLFCSPECQSIWQPGINMSNDIGNFGSYSSMSSALSLFNMYPHISQGNEDIREIFNDGVHPLGILDNHSNEVIAPSLCLSNSKLSKSKNGDDEEDEDIVIVDDVPEDSNNELSSKERKQMAKLTSKIRSQVMKIFSKTEGGEEINKEIRYKANCIDWIWETLRPLELPTTQAARVSLTNYNNQNLRYFSRINELDASAMEQRLIVGHLFFVLATAFLKKMISKSIKHALSLQFAREKVETSANDTNSNASITSHDIDHEPEIDNNVKKDNIIKDAHKIMLLPTHILHVLKTNPNNFDFITNMFMGE
ncbi:YEATS domain-containing protein 2 [Smittium mucronatum]|uniref:YEATS domain-containing protein 2 n=1 Tax=Smittium mucronatum TaxID=133383 RepID=A0A1R0H1W7_9FUNG|nr:YEATS domain-containing protein 2 [Smittium mucronatum]